MYIRRTTNKSRKSGKQYFTYRLVQSVRSENGVKQLTLLNLGAAFNLDRDKWPELSARIQEILDGQGNLFVEQNKIEEMAQDFASRIVLAQQTAETNDIASEYVDVDVNSLEMIRPRSISVEHVAKMALDDLKIPELLLMSGFDPQQAAVAIGVIVGRMCQPGSERATHTWLQNVSGIGELIDHEFSKTSQYQVYKIADKLFDIKKEIESHLFLQEKRLFGFEETITLYDLTNTYFEGTGKYNENAKRGHSKEKRTDCPLVTLAMVLDSSGFPKKTEVLEGNVSEPSTLSKMIDKLETKSDANSLEIDSKATIVMDAGIASEENIEWLKENGYNYIVVSRKRHREFNEDEAVIVKEDANCIVKVQRVLSEETDEVLFYCHSSQKEKKEQAIMDRFTQRFEESMTKLEAGLHKKRCMKKNDKVMEKIGRIKQQYSNAAKHYKITLTKDEKSGNVVKLVWERKQESDTKDSFPGVYCIRTSHKDLDEKVLWKTYTMLTDLESVFRSLKSELGLRPVYHQKTDRVTSHLFITVIAYHLVHLIRTKLKAEGITTSWSGLRKQLAGQSRITVTMHCRDNTVLHIRKSTQPEPRQREIYSALNLKSHPGEVVKTKIEKTTKSSAIKKKPKL